MCQTRNRTADLRCVPRSIRNDSCSRNHLSVLAINTIAPKRTTLGDVSKTGALQSIQQRIDESKSRLSSAETDVIEQSNDSSGGWGSRRGTAVWIGSSINIGQDIGVKTVS